VDDLCFLLALQVVVRRYDGSAVRRIERLLASSQAVAFREAVADLEPDRDELIESLGLTLPIPEPGPLPAPAANTSPSSRWARPWGRVAYRARTFGPTHGFGWGFAGAYFGVVFLLLLLGVPQEFLVPAWATATLALAGWAAVRGGYRCSTCRAKITSRSEECPACASLFIATLDEPPAKFRVGTDLGRRTYRVRGTYAGRYAKTAAIVAVLLALIPTFRHGSLASIALPPIAAAIGGWFVGSRKRLDLCSATACETVLPPGLTECPRCLGELRGEIDDLKDRL
jgi:hypothetical protein